MSARGVGYALAGLVVLPTLLASSPVAAAVAGPVPGTVFIQTVPALAGVHLLVGSSPVTTGAGGAAKVAVADFNSVGSKVSLASTALDARDTVALASVNVAPHTVKYESHLTVGLDVTSKVTLQISGGDTGVSPGDVHAIRLHSVTGKTILVDPHATPAVSLLSRQTSLIAGAVTAQVVTWSVDSRLAIRGVSVDTSGPPFDPLTEATWPLTLRPVAVIPGTVFIQTVPALAGVHLLVGSLPVTTGAGGVAKLTVADFNSVASKVSLASTALDAHDTVALANVNVAPHTVKYESHLTVGLNVTSKVTLQISGGNTGVSPGDVHAIRLHSVTGATILVDPNATPAVSLLSRQTRLIAGTITAQVVTWSIDSLLANPGVSVTTSGPPFDPLAEATWPLVLLPVAGTVVVDTVPATPGVSFGLEGATGTTDAQGHVTMPVTDLNGVDAGLNLSPSQALGSTVSVLRVAGLPSATTFGRHLVAALAVSLPISLGFTDSGGHSISPSRISDVKITGGGATVDISGAQLLSPVSVLSEQGKLANGSWQPQQVTYTVTRVTVDGSDAVFAGQQRFNPNTSSNWSISLSAFDLTVTVRDVLFGRRIASVAEVTRPDGKQYGVLLGAGQPTVLRSLVRGQYTLLTRSAVVGANSKILVSKNSDAEIRVVTLADVLVFAIVVLGASASVVVLGVSMSRRSKRRRIGASDE